MLQTTTSTFIQGLRSHSEEAWRTFDKRYKPIVIRVAQRQGLQLATAENFSQDVMMGIHKTFHTYDPSRARFRTWLFKVVRNRLSSCLAKLSQCEKQPDSSSVFNRLPDSGATTPDRVFEEEFQKAVWERCQEACRNLSPNTWQAFLYVTKEELPAKEAAKRLRISENAVFQAKRAVLRRLRQCEALYDLVG